MVSTCALLESTPRSTENESCAVTARMPGTLLAAIATPSPVPQMSRARSTVPAAIRWAASIATLGYGVCPSASTPTSMTRATPGLLSRSCLRICLYSKPASSAPITMRRGSGMSVLLLDLVGGECLAHRGHDERERDRARVGGSHAVLAVRSRPTHAGEEVGGRRGGAGRGIG